MCTGYCDLTVPVDSISSDYVSVVWVSVIG